MSRVAYIDCDLDAPVGTRVTHFVCLSLVYNETGTKFLVPRGTIR
ncbi:hypothetical protein ES702_03120 [subsurface metagenome]